MYKFAHVLQRCGRGWGIVVRRTGAALACGLALGCAVDLRPDSLASIPDATARSAGAERLVESARIHGLDRWQRFTQLRFRLRDAGVARCFRGGIRPFPSPQSLDVEVAVRDGSVRVRFADGPRQGDAVGIKGDLAYRIADSGALEFERDACAETYLRALQEALVLPFRLAILARTADVSPFAAGERTLGEKSYDLVLVTVPAPYGTSADEQYVLWIERASGRIEWLERTDRRRSRRAHEVLHYLNYTDVNGVMLPLRIERVDAVGDSAGQSLELTQLALD